MHKVIGIIPSRYTSRRFPGKPLALLGGIPIIIRVWNQAKKSRLIEKIMVATDDRRIFDTVVGHGGEAVMVEGDFASGSDRVAAAARKIKAEIVLNIQGDEPLIRPEIIDAVIGQLIENENVSMSSACCKMEGEAGLDDPNVVKAVLAKDGKALYFSRSPIPFSADHNKETDAKRNRIWYRHIGVYGFRYDFLQRFAALKPSELEIAEGLEQLRALENGFDIYCAIERQPFSGIDTPADISRAEKMLGG